jgi:hypothetical protein
VSLAGDALDDDGYIVNPARPGLIEDPWRRAVDHVVASCREIFADDIHSLYVRGSVARGAAVQGIADLDMILVLRDLRPAPLAATIARIETETGAAFAFVRGVELDPVPRAALRGPFRPWPRQAFLLKTQAVCIDGTDLIPALPPARPRDAMLESRRLEASVAYVRQKLASPDTSPRERQAYCVWLMKIIVRSAFEAVSHFEHCYTRELRACAAIFSKHHPAQRAVIDQAVAWAIDPSDDAAAITALLDSFALWLVALGKKARKTADHYAIHMP